MPARPRGASTPTPPRHSRTTGAACPQDVWARTQLLYVCSPDNPTGRVFGLAEWRELFALSDRHGFVIASDECYSEIYFDEARPPLGALAAAHALGRDGYPRLAVFGSLSKRSNAPGLRSGYVAGDAALMKAFLLYRTYHGAAMSPAVAAASIAAWNDEAHVRRQSRRIRGQVRGAAAALAPWLPCAMPDAAFYLWAQTPIDDAQFARRLLAEENVAVVPGSFLARDAHGTNPGQNRIRLALVAPARSAPRPSPGSWPSPGGSEPSTARLRSASSRPGRPVGRRGQRHPDDPKIPSMASILELPAPTPGLLPGLASGFRVSWPTLLLILAINTGIAAAPLDRGHAAVLASVHVRADLRPDDRVRGQRDQAVGQDQAGGAADAVPWPSARCWAS